MNRTIASATREKVNTSPADSLIPRPASASSHRKHFVRKSLEIPRESVDKILNNHTNNNSLFTNTESVKSKTRKPDHDSINQVTPTTKKRKNASATTKNENSKTTVDIPTEIKEKTKEDLIKKLLLNQTSHIPISPSMKRSNSQNRNVDSTSSVRSKTERPTSPPIPVPPKPKNPGISTYMAEKAKRDKLTALNKKKQEREIEEKKKKNLEKLDLFRSEQRERSISRRKLQNIDENFNISPNSIEDKGNEDNQTFAEPAVTKSNVKPLIPSTNLEFSFQFKVPPSLSQYSAPDLLSDASSNMITINHHPSTNHQTSTASLEQPLLKTASTQRTTIAAPSLIPPVFNINQEIVYDDNDTDMTDEVGVVNFEKFNNVWKMNSAARIIQRSMRTWYRSLKQSRQSKSLKPKLSNRSTSKKETITKINHKHEEPRKASSFPSPPRPLPTEDDDGFEFSTPQNPRRSFLLFDDEPAVKLKMDTPDEYNMISVFLKQGGLSTLHFHAEKNPSKVPEAVKDEETQVKRPETQSSDLSIVMETNNEGEKSFEYQPAEPIIDAEIELYESRVPSISNSISDEDSMQFSFQTQDKVPQRIVTQQDQQRSSRLSPKTLNRKLEIELSLSEALDETRLKILEVERLRDLAILRRHSDAQNSDVPSLNQQVPQAPSSIGQDYSEDFENVNIDLVSERTNDEEIIEDIELDEAPPEIVEEIIDEPELNIEIQTRSNLEVANEIARTDNKRVLTQSVAFGETNKQSHSNLMDTSTQTSFILDLKNDTGRDNRKISEYENEDFEIHEEILVSTSKPVSDIDEKEDYESVLETAPPQIHQELSPLEPFYSSTASPSHTRQSSARIDFQAKILARLAMQKQQHEKLYSEVRNRCRRVEMVLDRVIELCTLPSENFMPDVSFDEGIRKLDFLIPQSPVPTNDRPKENVHRPRPVVQDEIVEDIVIPKEENEEEIIEEEFSNVVEQILDVEEDIQSEPQLIEEVVQSVEFEDYHDDADQIQYNAALHALKLNAVTPSLVSKLNLDQSFEVPPLSATSPVDDEDREAIGRIEKLKEEILERRRCMAELESKRKEKVRKRKARSQEIEEKLRLELSKMDETINDFAERLNTQDEDFNLNLETVLTPLLAPETFDETSQQPPMETTLSMKQIEDYLDEDFEITDAIEENIAETDVAVMIEPVTEQPKEDIFVEEEILNGSVMDVISEEITSVKSSISSIEVALPSRLDTLKVDENNIVSADIVEESINVDDDNQLTEDIITDDAPDYDDDFETDIAAHILPSTDETNTSLLMKDLAVDTKVHQEIDLVSLTVPLQVTAEIVGATASAESCEVSIHSGAPISAIPSQTDDQSCTSSKLHEKTDSEIKEEDIIKEESEPQVNLNISMDSTAPDVYEDEEEFKPMPPVAQKGSTTPSNPLDEMFEKLQNNTFKNPDMINTSISEQEPLKLEDLMSPVINKPSGHDEHLATELKSPENSNLISENVVDSLPSFEIQNAESFNETLEAIMKSPIPPSEIDATEELIPEEIPVEVDNVSEKDELNVQLKEDTLNVKTENGNNSFVEQKSNIMRENVKSAGTESILSPPSDGIADEMMDDLLNDAINVITKPKQQQQQLQPHTETMIHDKSDLITPPESPPTPLPQHQNKNLLIALSEEIFSGLLNDLVNEPNALQSPTIGSKPHTNGSTLAQKPDQEISFDEAAFEFSGLEEQLIQKNSQTLKIEDFSKAEFEFKDSAFIQELGEIIGPDNNGSFMKPSRTLSESKLSPIMDVEGDEVEWENLQEQLNDAFGSEEPKVSDNTSDANVSKGEGTTIESSPPSKYEEVMMRVPELFKGVEGIESIKSQTDEMKFSTPQISESYLDNLNTGKDGVTKEMNKLICDAINFGLRHVYAPFSRYYDASNLLRSRKLVRPPLLIEFTEQECVLEKVRKLVSGWMKYSMLHGQNLDYMLIQEIKRDEVSWRVSGVGVAGKLNSGGGNGIKRARRNSVGTIISAASMLRDSDVTKKDEEMAASFEVGVVKAVELVEDVEVEVKNMIVEEIWQMLLEDTVMCLNEVENKKVDRIVF